MFDSEEWLRLISKLFSLSRAERLEWTLESNGMVTTQVAGIDYILGSVDADDRPPYFLAVGNASEQRELARLESTPSADEPWGADGTSPEQLIPGLYSLAMRLAQGAPQLLNKLLADLDAVAPKSKDVPF